MSIHADYAQFTKIMNQSLAFKVDVEKIASEIHQHYCVLAEKKGELKMGKDFIDLTKDEKEDNRAAAKRIPPHTGFGRYVCSG